MTALDRLALDGGTPQLVADHVSTWPQFTSDDDLEVLRAARHGLPGHQLRDTTKLERRWSSLTGCDTVIACVSGHAAVALALAGLDIEAGDQVIGPAGAGPLAAALSAAGANVVGADVDAQTLHLDPQAVEAAITDRTRAIAVVDRFGTTADYRALRALAGQNSLAIIEDGSRSIGATLDGRPVGGLGSASVCVFGGDGPGRGLGSGALYATAEAVHATNARRSLLVDDPLTSVLDEATAGSAIDRASSWVAELDEIVDPGAQVMPALDAAVVLERLDTLDDDVAVRAAKGNHLRRRLETVPGIWLPEVVRGASHTYSSFPLVVVPDEFGLPDSAATALRDTLVDCMTAEGLWVDAVRPRPGLSGDGRFPVLETTTAGGLLVGRSLDQLGPPHGSAEIDRIADCFVKILVDNVDRVRQLTLERASTHMMI